MASAPHIDAFKSSCLRADEYPLNLSGKTTRLYPSALEALKHRLGDAESHLLLPNEEKVDFSLRDLSADGEGKVFYGPREVPGQLNFESILTPE